jgi:5-methylcytosine-specific restriction endonuclease McrA
MCWLCGLPVRYDLGPRHTLAPTVDHVIEVDRHEVDPFDTRLWRLAHFGCNSTRGNEYREARDAGKDVELRTSRPI